jgi:amino acid transporter
VLIIFPDHHNSVSFVFTDTLNNSGLSGVGFFFIFLLGFLQAQYTYTGYDASAHLSEETHDASVHAAKGVVNSVLVSAIAGYVLILAFTFAITDLDQVADAGSFAAIEVLDQALSETGAEILLAIAVGGQLFCGMSAVTSASRMLFAFSRDGAVPGWRIWSKLNRHYVPANAVVLICFLALVLALPAWSGDAFFVYAAVTSVATIGLYVAYILPVYLRLRAGKSFDPGPWSLGRWHKPINVIAILWVIFICILFIMPVTDAGVWWGDDFDYKSANYAPIVFLIVLTGVTIWWHTSAKKWFKGPRRTVDEEIEVAEDEVDESPGGTAAPA